jgi:hypothetical protein
MSSVFKAFLSAKSFKYSYEMDAPVKLIRIKIHKITCSFSSIRKKESPPRASQSYMSLGGGGGRGGLKYLQNFGKKWYFWRNFWLFWLKNTHFQKMFGTSPDNHKSAEEFPKKFDPSHPPPKIFLNHYPLPKIFGQAHVCYQLLLYYDPFKNILKFLQN